MKDKELEIEKRIDELKNKSDGEDHTEEIIALEKKLLKSVFNRMFFGDNTDKDASKEK